MKRIVAIIILSLVCTLNTQAQHKEKMKEKIRAQKTAFITERLDLSTKEAQEFWPIYNAFEEKLEQFRRNDLREIKRAMRKGDLSEDEAQKALDKFLLIEDKIHNLKKQLVKDLNDVIPPQKIMALKAAEDAFKTRLLESLRKRKAKMKNFKNN